MKVLIFGAPGSGKTYISSALRVAGYRAFDADMIEGLSSWEDEEGIKVRFPTNADEEFFNKHSYLWNREFLSAYLKKEDTIYIFGISSNIFDVLDLFDRVYFLKVNQKLQRERLEHTSRRNPLGDTEYQRDDAIAWGWQLTQQAEALAIPTIDATLSPLEVFEIIQG